MARPPLLVRLLALALALLAPAAAPAEEENPVVPSVGAASVPAGGTGVVPVDVLVPEGYHVYRDMTEVRVDQPGAFRFAAPDFPPGMLGPDPAFPEQKREMYEASFRIALPVAAPRDTPLGDHPVEVQVRYQSCRGNLCFLPVERTLSIVLTVVPAGTVLPPPPPPAAPDPGITPAQTGQPAPDPARFGPRPEVTEQDPVAVRAVAGGPNEILVGFYLLEGWHVNRDLTGVEVGEGAPVTAGASVWPSGERVTDAALGIDRVEIGGDFLVRLPVTGPAGRQKVPVIARFQACKAALCHMPRSVDLEVQVEVAPSGEVASTPPSGATSGSTFERMQQKGLFWLVLFVFGAGFLVSLTPCVLPLVPITMGIIGVRTAGSRWRGLALSLTYVAGLALVYTTLGVVSGLTGSLFGGWMQSPWVVGTVGLFFAAMGLSMFGLFDVALPSGLATRLNQVGGVGFAGAFVIGMVGAVVAGPCSGPVIVSLMVLIGTQGQVLLGVALMLAFSLGMGVIFVLAGVFAASVLKPGAWMETVKHAFGVLLLLGAVYYVHAHLVDWVTALLVSGILLATAVFGWPAHEEEGFVVARARKLYAVVAALVGAWLLLGVLGARGFILPPIAPAAGPAGEAAVHAGIPFERDEQAVLARAAAEGKPVVIDFGAEWCAACKELEHITYVDPRVVETARGFVPLYVDATRSSDPAVADVLGRYGVKGLPTVLFLAPDGTPIPDLTVTGFLPPDAFLTRMEAALTASRRR